MKRLVSLLAIALVSSLFAAGCGKLKTCAEANNKKEVCEDSSKFENKHCTWAPKEGAKADSNEGTCSDLAATPATKDACALGLTEETCKTTEANQDGFKCTWNEKATPKCAPGFAEKKKVEAKKDETTKAN